MEDPPPELKAYLDHHQRLEEEQRKWEIDLPESRRQYWGELEQAGRWDELYADQGYLFGEWLDAHPELGKQLIDVFLGHAKFADVPHPLLPRSAYYQGRIFWLAANVILRQYGMKDELAAAVIEELATACRRSGVGHDRWDVLQMEKQQAYRYAAGHAYFDVCQFLNRHGVGAVRALNAYLKTCVATRFHALFLEEVEWMKAAPEEDVSSSTNDLDPSEPDHRSDTRKKPSLTRRTTPLSELTTAEEGNRADPSHLVPDDELWRLSSEYRSDAQQKVEDVLDAVALSRMLDLFRRELTPRQMHILQLLLKGHTHQEIADKLGASTKTVQREIGLIQTVGIGLGIEPTDA